MAAAEVGGRLFGSNLAVFFTSFSFVAREKKEWRLSILSNTYKNSTQDSKYASNIVNGVTHHLRLHPVGEVLGEL